MVRETSVGDFYRKLQQAARTASANGFPLLIFPSTCDADALCAYKIVTRLLESDSICHSVYPVAGFSSIQTLAGKAVRSNDDPVVLLLINWGASRNLHRLLELGSQVQVFVVDSHRPIHLHNLSAKNTQVTMLFTRDDEIQAGMTASSILNEVSSFSNTYDSEPELELEDDDSDEEFASDDDDGEAERIKRRRQGGLELQRQEQRKKAEYYRSGCFHGRPAGCLMFDIAHSLHKNNNELLWLACVALTDQFVHERITAERYNVTAIELEGHVSSAGNAEKVTSVTLRDGTKVRAPDVSRIVSDDEPRLMLLREWSLYDAMMNSFFVAPKLKTWGDAGLRTMKLLFAKMGISLAECQQSFRYMSSETKKGLKEEFEKLEKTVFSGKLYFRNFHKYHGYGNQVSAADVVYGVSALLEAAGSDETSDYTDNFCKAVRALSPNEWQTLQSGMQLAIQVQRACISIGSAAILKKDEIKMSKAFRYLTIADCPNARLLAHPLSLTKLCYFLMDALKESGHSVKPMVCIAVLPGATKHLVVGVSHRPRLGAANGNKFGLVFRTIAQKLGIIYSHDAFESSWIHLDTEIVNRFLAELRMSLANYSTL